MKNTLSNSFPPVFCDCCANLALAELESAPLCGKCLMVAIEELGAEAILRVTPLSFSRPSMNPQAIELKVSAA